MLVLIEGGFTSKNHKEICEMIRRDVENKERAFLIVPEQQTLGTEAEMCDILPSSAPLFFEVTNFTRFTNTAFRSLGGLSGEYCSSEEESLIMWRTLTELSPMLHMTHGSTRITGGVVKRALDAVKEMERMGAVPADLERLILRSEISDKRLTGKIEDICLIYTVYKKMFGEKYTSIEDDTLSLAKKLLDSPEFIKGCKIYIEGFTSFTEPQIKLLENLMRLCELTVSLALPWKERELFEYTEVKKTADKLLMLADRAGCDKILTKLGDDTDPLCSLYGQMGSLLWRPSGALDNNYLHLLENDRERVRIFEARTPFEECDFIAADIKRKVMQGARYSDFTVIARHADSYCGIIDVSLSRAGIPHFISKRRDICSLEAIKLINTAYLIITRGFKQEDVITYLKCGLTDIEECDRDEFELYVEKWNIDGIQFYDGIAWNMNPRGYTERTEKDIKKMLSIENTREKLISPLLELKEATRSADTVRKQAEALMSFLCSIGMEKALYHRAKLHESLNEPAAAEENARLWEIICDSLDKLVSVIGDLPADTESFFSMLSVIFAGKSIGRIPTRRDEVTVGSADMLRTERKKHVYLIGVNSGEFPAVPKDTSYFSPKDRAIMSELGLPIDSDTSVSGARELYCFTRAMTSASESVTLIYTSASESLSPLQPSEVIERICKITKGTVNPQSVAKLPIKDRLYSEYDAIMLSGELDECDLEQIRLSLEGREEQKLLDISERDLKNKDSVLSREAIGILYNGDLYMSQSRLESFLSCPFKYFLESNLKLDKGESAEFSSATIGTFVHSVLEKFFYELKEKNLTPSELNDEKKEAIVQQASRKYIEAALGEGYNQARTRTAVNRLSKAAKPIVDGLCDELEHCSFRPTFFELPTNGRSADVASPIMYLTEDGDRVIIQGIVDRVDTFKHGEDIYIRVIDYKTGKKNFSPDDMATGENLQMFLYLKSIVETESEDFREKIGAGKNGRLIPAGVLYVSASVKDTVVDNPSDFDAAKAIIEATKRDGMVLDNYVSIAAMNERYLPSVLQSDKKTRVVDPTRLYSPLGWHKICTDIENAVLDIVSDMKSGNVKAEPKQLKSRSSHPCDYCVYKIVCRNAQSKRAR